MYRLTVNKVFCKDSNSLVDLQLYASRKYSAYSIDLNGVIQYAQKEGL